MHRTVQWVRKTDEAPFCQKIHSHPAVVRPRIILVKEDFTELGLLWRFRRKKACKTLAELAAFPLSIQGRSAVPWAPTMAKRILFFQLWVVLALHLGSRRHLSSRIILAALVEIICKTNLLPLVLGSEKALAPNELGMIL